MQLAVHSGGKWREGTRGTSRGAIWTPNMPRIAPGVFHFKSFEYLHQHFQKWQKRGFLLRTEQLGSDIGGVVADNVTEFQKYCNNCSDKRPNQFSKLKGDFEFNDGTKGLEEQWGVQGGPHRKLLFCCWSVQGGPHLGAISTRIRFWGMAARA